MMDLGSKLAKASTSEKKKQIVCIEVGSVDMNGYFDFKSSPGEPVGLVIKCSSFPRR